MTESLLNYFDGDELASSAWLSKYAMPGDVTPDDMHKRMAKEFARIESNHSNESNKVPTMSEHTIYNLFKDFKYVIPQGSIMSQLGSNSIGSLSNCFVIGSPEDSYGGIFQKDEEMAQLMKRRGGVGIDISSLRPVGTPTSNAAKSSTGAISFMKRFSETTREVAQNGRRGALMISIEVSHPDIEEFIKIKRDLTKVTGANISIKLNSQFMTAVESESDYILQFPIESNLTDDIDISELPYNELVTVQGGWLKRVKSKEIWDDIIESAHGVAEPGMMFWDRMINYAPDGVYSQFKPVSTNPCGEIGIPAYDSCRLIAMNLLGFVMNPFTKDAYFDFDLFYEKNYQAMQLSDDLVDLEIEHVNRIIEKIKSDPESGDVKRRELELWNSVLEIATDGRRTGLGFTALADTLASLNIGYGTTEGVEMVEKIMKVKFKSELRCTIDLSIDRGTFNGFDPELERVPNDWYDFVKNEFPDEFAAMQMFGRRNVSWNTLSPTGTVSLLARTSSAVEPVFLLSYKRRKKINPNDDNVRVDYTDESGDTFQEFHVMHPAFEKWIDIQNEVYDMDYDKTDPTDLAHAEKASPWYKSTASDLDWKFRVDLQAVCQKYITHSISSTVNLPSDVSLEEVSNIYEYAWKQGLKGITVYRDGSRSGVLVSNDDTPNKVQHKLTDAIKRPKSIQADAYTISVKGDKINVYIGILDKLPYEVFAHPQIEESVKGSGLTEKRKKGQYVFVQGEFEKELTNLMSDEQVAITRLLSASLRHGMDIKFLVEQLNKSDGDITSFTKAIGRVLKKYIPDGSTSTVTCSECGSSNVVFEEGCARCLDCGSSKCG